MTDSVAQAVRGNFSSTAAPGPSNRSDNSGNSLLGSSLLDGRAASAISSRSAWSTGRAGGRAAKTGFTPKLLAPALKSGTAQINGSRWVIGAAANQPEAAAASGLIDAIARWIGAALAPLARLFLGRTPAAAPAAEGGLAPVPPALSGSSFPYFVRAADSSPEDPTRPKNLAANSHFNEPIPSAGLHGDSRSWGDAPLWIQQRVINEIIAQAGRRNWDSLQTAFALAVARHESGFNPDAAAHSTSAAGVGQLIDKTGAAFGLTAQNRFSIPENVAAMLALIEQNQKLAQSPAYKRYKSADGLALQYALYHDGPGLNFGGMDIAAKKVIPWADTFYQWLTKTQMEP